MTSIFSQFTSNPAPARVRRYEKRGADWYELTTLGNTVATRKLTPSDVARLHPVEGICE